MNRNQSRCGLLKSCQAEVRPWARKGKSHLVHSVSMQRGTYAISSSYPHFPLVRILVAVIRTLTLARDLNSSGQRAIARFSCLKWNLMGMPSLARLKSLTLAQIQTDLLLKDIRLILSTCYEILIFITICSDLFGYSRYTSITLDYS